MSPTDPSPTPAEPTPAWSRARLVAFRFAFVLLGFYAFDKFYEYVLPHFDLRIAVGTFVREYLLPGHGLFANPPRLLSGLVTAECVANGRVWYCWLYKIAWLVVVAAAATALWSWLDRGRRRDHRRLYELLRVALRYTLAPIMAFYAWFKLNGTQFWMGSPGFEMVTPLGEWTPQQFMWEAMGLSYAYSSFTALGELTGAVLLLWRRTTTLGALILIPILANILILDWVHKVAIAETALLYLAMCGFLILPDLRRLCDFYLRGRVAAAPPPPTRRRIDRWWKPWLKTAVLVYFLAGPVTRTRLGHYWSRPPEDALPGTYAVERQEVDGAPVPPRFGDARAWRHVAVVAYRTTETGRDEPRSLQVRRMDGTIETYPIEVDAERRTIALREPYRPGAAAKRKPPAGKDKDEVQAVAKDDAKADAKADAKPDAQGGDAGGEKPAKPPPIGTLSFERPDPDGLVLTGDLAGEAIRLQLRRVRAADWVWPPY